MLCEPDICAGCQYLRADNNFDKLQVVITSKTINLDESDSQKARKLRENILPVFREKLISKPAHTVHLRAHILAAVMCPSQGPRTYSCQSATSLSVTTTKPSPRLKKIIICRESRGQRRSANIKGECNVYKTDDVSNTDSMERWKKALVRIKLQTENGSR
ncbi:hypothetical protein K1T71_009284 [Dendrolimus kikuchii]|uniref:Uncharacterized protein n=1 Tax=Dendrolimus kikuchii TaxID=765133 RepID=A0ACC1CU41_9NEOP|nr:hypothetical protein K1T71_009284 [Dendrolimus kikuchii]